MSVKWSGFILCKRHGYPLTRAGIPLWFRLAVAVHRLLCRPVGISADQWLCQWFAESTVRFGLGLSGFEDQGNPCLVTSGFNIPHGPLGDDVLLAGNTCQQYILAQRFIRDPATAALTSRHYGLALIFIEIKQFTNRSPSWSFSAHCFSPVISEW